MGLTLVHNRDMTFWRTMRTLALLALFLAAFTPIVDATWQCEGRTCGTTPWFCCCTSPVGARDANCLSSHPRFAWLPGPTSDVAACARDCGCVLTFRTPPAARLPVPSNDRGSLFDLAAWAPALVAPALLPTEIVARFFDRRGPPIPSPVLGTPSLRGPPLA